MLPLLFDKGVCVCVFFVVVFFKPHVKNVFCFLSRGFCYFNSIAIAAKQLREKYKLNKILVVDWVSYMTLFPHLAAGKKHNYNTTTTQQDDLLEQMKSQGIWLYMED